MRTTSLAKATRDYRIHWHVLLVHFPISMFGTGFMFQTLHLIFAPDAFTLASAVVVTAGTVTMIPTVISGWMSWRHSYKGARTKVFTRKIIIAFTMLGVSVALTAWRLTFSSLFDEKLSPAHWLFMAGTVLLITGAVAEGYFGGKLRHST